MSKKQKNRTDIRKKLVELLKGKTLAKDNVFTDRSILVDDNQLPAIIILPRSEDVELYAQSPREYKRTLQISIEVYATGNDGEQGTPQTVSDNLDLITQKIEEIISVDDTLECTVDDIMLSGIEYEFQPEGAAPLGAAKIAYEAIYYTLSPASVLDQEGVEDFKIASANFRIGGLTLDTTEAEPEQIPDTIIPPLEIEKEITDPKSFDFGVLQSPTKYLFNELLPAGIKISDTPSRAFAISIWYKIEGDLNTVNFSDRCLISNRIAGTSTPTTLGDDYILGDYGFSVSINESTGAVTGPGLGSINIRFSNGSTVQTQRYLPSEDNGLTWNDISPSRQPGWHHLLIAQGTPNGASTEFTAFLDGQRMFRDNFDPFSVIGEETVDTQSLSVGALGNGDRPFEGKIANIAIFTDIEAQYPLEPPAAVANSLETFIPQSLAEEIYEAEIAGFDFETNTATYKLAPYLKALYGFDGVEDNATPSTGLICDFADNGYNLIPQRTDGTELSDDLADNETAPVPNPIVDSLLLNPNGAADKQYLISPPNITTGLSAWTLLYWMRHFTGDAVTGIPVSISGDEDYAPLQGGGNEDGERHFLHLHTSGGANRWLPYQKTWFGDTAPVNEDFATLSVSPGPFVWNLYGFVASGSNSKVYLSDSTVNGGTGGFGLKVDHVNTITALSNSIAPLVFGAIRRGPAPRVFGSDDFELFDRIHLYSAAFFDGEVADTDIFKFWNPAAQVVPPFSAAKPVDFLNISIDNSPGVSLVSTWDMAGPLQTIADDAIILDRKGSNHLTMKVYTGGTSFSDVANRSLLDNPNP